MRLSRRALVAGLSAIGLSGSASADDDVEATGWGDGGWGTTPWGGSSEDCFIATAAYGSADHDCVLELRAFRDEVLARSAPGRLFIRTYYRCSPPVARWIARTDRRKRLTRRLFIRPITKITNHV